MTADSERKSRAMWWLVSLGAVPMFYVLSIGPVDGLTARYSSDPGSESWFERDYSPLFYITDRIPWAREPINQYRQWWDDLLKKK